MAPLRVLVVSPKAPPMGGGVADHVGLSLRALAQVDGGQALSLALLSGPGASPEAIAPAELLAPQLAWGPAAWHQVAAVAQAWGAEVLLLHHVPHLYDRRGLPWGPSWALGPGGPLRRWPVVVLAHELNLGWHEGWRGWTYGPLQRLLWRWMLPGAARVVCTVEARAQALRAALPGPPGAVRCLPVGASLPPPPPWSRAEARTRLNLPQEAFVLADLGLAHPGKGLQAVARALDALRAAGFPAVAALGGELALAHPHALRLGRLEPEAASALLACSDLVPLPFTEGASGRRTSLMNAWQAGACVLSTWGEQSDAEALPSSCWAQVPAGDATAFAAAAVALARAPARRDALAASGRAHFEQTLAWPVLAQRWAQLLLEVGAQGLTSG